MLCCCVQVVPPAVYLRVTENVHHIVSFIEGIISNGHAYPTEDGEWSYRVRSQDHIGQVTTCQLVCLLYR